MYPASRPPAARSKRRGRWSGAALLVCSAGALLTLPQNRLLAASASDNRTVNVNYVYASQLGFGGYSLAGLTADVFTLPLEHSFPVGPGGSWALRVMLPIQLGLYSFRGTDTNGQRISLDQQSLAVVPGVELAVPIASRFVVKPFVEAGAGHSFGVSDSNPDAWIYAAGVRTVTQWQAGQYTLSVGTAALYAGDHTMGPGFSESYTAVEVGFEVRRPLGFSIRGITPDLGVFVAGYEYPQPLQFSRFLQPTLNVHQQGEVGVSIGAVQPLDMLWLGNSRIGVGYVFGGGLTVWSVNFGFPF